IWILPEHDPAEHESAVIRRVRLNLGPEAAAAAAESLLSEPLGHRRGDDTGRDERHQEAPSSARRERAERAHQASLLGPRPEPMPDCFGHDVLLRSAAKLQSTR